MNLDVLDGRFGIARLDPRSPVPAWVFRAGFVSVTRTDDELSIICDESVIPDEVRPETGWRALRVEGPLDFGLTGVLSSIALPLATAGVPIFAISTFDTDYTLVREPMLNVAVAALRRAGHRVGGAVAPPPGATDAARPGATIRQARLDEEDWLIALMPRLAAFPLPAWRTVDQIARADRGILTDALHGRIEGAAILVAELEPGGRRAGYVLATTRDDYFTHEPHAHVEVLVVAPEAEGHGVARALMVAIEAWAVGRGLRVVTLNVFDRNSRAQQLYERLGYERETIRYRKSIPD
jgi:hypothetical protein